MGANTVWVVADDAGTAARAAESLGAAPRGGGRGLFAWAAETKYYSAELEVRALAAGEAAEALAAGAPAGAPAAVVAVAAAAAPGRFGELAALLGSGAVPEDAVRVLAVDAGAPGARVSGDAAECGGCGAAHPPAPGGAAPAGPCPLCPAFAAAAGAALDAGAEAVLVSLDDPALDASLWGAPGQEPERMGLGRVREVLLAHPWAGAPVPAGGGGPPGPGAGAGGSGDEADWAELGAFGLAGAPGAGGGDPVEALLAQMAGHRGRVGEMGDAERREGAARLAEQMMEMLGIGPDGEDRFAGGDGGAPGAGPA